MGKYQIKMKKLYVYILECIDNSYYTGVTNNLERRLAEHHAGINPDCYTFSRRPLELVFFEVFDSPEKAILFEKKIKNWSKAKKTALIQKNWDKLPELSKCNNESSHINFNKNQRPLDSARGDQRQSKKNNSAK
jgi:putative endonuclease